MNCCVKLTGYIILIFSMLGVQVNLSAQWSQEKNISSGKAPDLDVDPNNGHLHIVALNNGVLYTETDAAGTIINQEQVTGTAGIPNEWYFGVTVAVDNVGYPHVCYRTDSGNYKYNVYYIRKTASGWGDPVLVSENVIRGYMVRMDIDAENRVHIVRGSAVDDVWGPATYYRIENGTVVHSQENLTSFRADDRVEIDASNDNELHIILGCPNPGGGPISYWRSYNSGDDIDLVGDIHDSAAKDRNGSPDMFVDASGTVHICYGAAKDGDIGDKPSVRYSRWESGSKVRDVTATKQGDCTAWKQDQGLGSVAATADGQVVVIAFTETDGGDLYTKTSFNGGETWEDKVFIANDCGGAESRDKPVIRARGNTFYVVYPASGLKLRILNVSDDQPPIADAGGPYQGEVDAPLQFDGTSSSDDVAIINYQWNFGDGNTGTGETIQHTYSGNGTFNVTLTVSDSAGQIDTDNAVVTIGQTGSEEWSQPIHISAGDTPDFDIHPATGHLHLAVMYNGVTYIELDNWGNKISEEVVPGSEKDEGMLSFGASIAVDSKGFPHIGYRDYRGNNKYDLYYTYKTASGWTTPYKVAAGVLRGYKVRLAIDAADRVYYCHSITTDTETNLGPVHMYIFKDGNLVFHQDNIEKTRGDSRYELDVSEDGYVDLIAGDLSYPSQGGPIYVWRTAVVGGELEYKGDHHHEDAKRSANDSPDVFVDAAGITHMCYGVDMDFGIDKKPSLRYLRFDHGTKIRDIRVTEEDELLDWKFGLGIGSIAASADGQTVVAAYLQTEDGQLMTRVSNDEGETWENYEVLSSGWHCTEGRNKQIIRAHGNAFYLIYPKDGIKLRILGTPSASEPHLAVTPTSLDFNNYLEELTFTVRNNGGGSLEWSAGSVSSDWVTGILPQSGLLEYGQSEEVTVTVSRSGMADGEYSDNLPLYSNGGDTEVTLQMRVGSQTEWRINCGGESYIDNEGNEWLADEAYAENGQGYVGGGAYSTSDPISGTEWDPLYQSEHYGMDAYRFDVPNGDYAITLYFAEIYHNSNGRRVFSVSLEGNTIIEDLDIYQQVGHDAALAIPFSTRALGIQIDDNRIDIEFTSSVDDAKISAIKIVKLPPLVPILSISPTAINLGDTNTVDTLTVSNIGESDLDWNVVNGYSEWITAIEPASGQVTVGNSEDVIITIDRSGLSEGVYSDTLKFESNGGAVNIPVSMTVYIPPLLSVTPATLDFDSTQTSLSFTVSNTGGSQLTWEASEDPEQSWIVQITPSSDTLTASQSTEVNVQIDRTGLSAGDYSGTISVNSNGGESDVVVTMNVPKPPVLSVSPTMIDFDSSVVTQTFNITNSGGGSLFWEITVNPEYTWLVAVEPQSDSLTAHQTQSVTITIDRNGMSAGDYNGAINITSNGGNQDVVVQFSIISTAVAENGNIIPTEYKLWQNHPNPFNNSTLFKFDLPEPGRVKIVLYNIFGQKIKTLTDRWESAGSYQLPWDGKNAMGQNLPSGIYIVHMMTDQYQKSIKLTLMK